MIQKTEAIVLKVINHGDSSKIATLYSRSFGRLKVIAKGVRNPKSRFMGLFQPTHHLRIVFYEKSHSELQLFSSGEVVRSYYTLLQDFDRLAFAQLAMDVLERAIVSVEPHPVLYELACKTLGNFDNATIQPIKTYWYFHLRTLGELGFRPAVNNCRICSKSLEGTPAAFDRQQAILMCESCSLRHAGGIVLPLEAMKVLQVIDREDWDTLTNLTVSRGARRALWKFIWLHAKTHLEPLRRIKSLTVLEQLYHQTE